VAKYRRGLCEGLASGVTPVESEPCVLFNGVDIFKAELVKVTKVGAISYGETGCSGLVPPVLVVRMLRLIQAHLMFVSSSVFLST